MSPRATSPAGCDDFSEAAESPNSRQAAWAIETNRLIDLTCNVTGNVVSKTDTGEFCFGHLLTGYRSGRERFHGKTAWQNGLPKKHMPRWAISFCENPFVSRCQFQISGQLPA
jgi:hypothetical protein